MGQSGEGGFETHLVVDRSPDPSTNSTEGLPNQIRHTLRLETYGR
jgi:hypothetical protein